MPKNKKIIIVALISSKLDKESFLKSIRENLIGEGNQIVAEVIQRRGISRSKKVGGSKNMDAPMNPKTFMGSGKILELKEEVKNVKPELVVFLNKLNKKQQTIIEELIGCEIEII